MEIITIANYITPKLDDPFRLDHRQKTSFFFLLIISTIMESLVGTNFRKTSCKQHLLNLSHTSSLKRVSCVEMHLSGNLMIFQRWSTLHLKHLLIFRICFTYSFASFTRAKKKVFYTNLTREYFCHQYGLRQPNQRRWDLNVQKWASLGSTVQQDQVQWYVPILRFSPRRIPLSELLGYDPPYGFYLDLNHSYPKIIQTKIIKTVTK